MRKNIIVIVLILIALSILFWVIQFFSPDTIGSEGHPDDKEAHVTIERTDNSIKSDTGEILAYVYYDKPVITGVRCSDRINAFFESEQDGWFKGANRLTHFQSDWMKDFRNVLSDARDSLGDETISEQPLCYTIESDVVLLNERYLSIRQIATVQTTGKRSWHYFGSTFDLQTGELVSIDKLLEINADELRNHIVRILSEKILDYNHNLSLQDLKRVYGPNSKHDYQIEYDGEDIDLRYEFYFDDKSYYIILNHATLLDAGVIMKWNGKLNEEFSAQLIGYVKKSDGKYRLLEY